MSSLDTSVHDVTVINEQVLPHDTTVTNVGTVADINVSQESDKEEDEQQTTTTTKKKKSKVKRTPLPYLDLIAVTLCFMCEGFAYTFVSPFASYMILGFGITKSEDNVGFFTGTLAGCYSLAQFFTSFIFGYIADKTSKKLTILFSTVACIGFVLLFGFSPNFGVAVLARAMNGGLNGNVAIVKAHLSDITDDSNQALAFSIMGFGWAVGAVGGPLVGGYLSQPVEKYNMNSPVFKKFPYALPCIVIAGLLVFSFFITLFLMSFKSPAQKKRDEERKRFEAEEKERNQRQEQSAVTPSTPDISTPNTPDISTPNTPSSTAPMIEDRDVEEVDAYTNTVKPPLFKRLYSNSTKEVKDYLSVVLTRNIMVVVGLFFMSSIIDTFQEELLPVWAILTPSKGGIAFGTSDIGNVSLFIGCLMLLEPIVIPIMDRVFGALWTLRISYLCIIPLALVPQIHYAHKSNVAIWLSFTVYSIVRAFACSLSFTAVYILINFASRKGTAGRVMSLSNSAGCLAKVIAPFTAGPLFAASARLSRRTSQVYLSLPFCLCSLMACFAFVLSFLLPPSITDHRPNEDEDAQAVTDKSKEEDISGEDSDKAAKKSLEIEMEKKDPIPRREQSLSSDNVYIPKEEAVEDIVNEAEEHNNDNNIYEQENEEEDENGQEMGTDHSIEKN